MSGVSVLCRCSRAMVMACLGWLCAFGCAWGAAWPISKVELAKGDLGAANLRVAGEGWRAADLPDPWLRAARSGTWTYRFSLDVCPPPGGAGCSAPDQVEAIWIPKAGRELAVWVNGVRLLHLGPFGEVERDLTRRPILIPVPVAMLHSGSNEFRLVVKAPAHQVAGLSRVWLGGFNELSLMHAPRDYLVMGMPGVVASASATMAVLGVLIALRFGGAAVWLFSVISVLWTVREVLLLVGFRVLPLDAVLALAALLQSAVVLMASWLLLDLMSLADRRWVRWLKWLIVGTPFAALAWWLGGDSAWAWMWAWRRLTDVAGLCMTALAAFTFCRQPSWSRLFVAVGMTGSATLAFLDVWWLELSGQPEGFEHVPLTSLMGMFFLIPISASIYMRVARALRVEQRHKQLLSDEVLRQRRELEHLHERESLRLRAEAVENERARIVREMHDGLGSQLVGLLSTVESGDYSQAELSSEVHEAMGQLRLTIDTLDPAGDDLASLLGQLRFRLEGRLRKAGLSLHWKVPPLADVGGFSPPELSHLQRLFYEAFTNVIKHASASTVHVSVEHDEEHRDVVICIRDNGLGFDQVDAHSGRGLRNMHHRADQLGASLRITSATGQGTEVLLRLPAR